VPHPQSAIFRDHARAARLPKRAQPKKMEETLDGDRVLELMERYLREGSTERISALLDLIHDVELLFSSPAQKNRLEHLRQRETNARLRRHRSGAA